MGGLQLVEGVAGRTCFKLGFQLYFGIGHQFNFRFYTFALIFVIFDVEVAFLYPWALVFKTLMNNGFGGFIFLEVMVFLCILMVGFVYCWVKGDLDWLKVKPFMREAVVEETPEPGDAAIPEEPQEVAA